MPTNFGEDWSEIVTNWPQFSEVQYGRSRHIEFLALGSFPTDRRVLYQIHNISTIKFGETWSNSKELAIAFRNSRWRQFDVSTLYNTVETTVYIPRSINECMHLSSMYAGLTIQSIENNFFSKLCLLSLQYRNIHKVL